MRSDFNSVLFNFFPPSKSLAILLHTINLKEKMFEYDMTSIILLNLIRRMEFVTKLSSLSAVKSF